MKINPTYLLLFFTLIGNQGIAQQVVSEQFLRGNWKIDETRLVSAFIDKDSTIKRNSDLSKGYFHQIVSFKDHGQSIEYNDVLGRNYPDSLNIKQDKFKALASTYALKDGVLAFKVNNSRVRPNVLYFHPDTKGDRLVLEMDLPLMIKSGVIDEKTVKAKRVISGSITVVMSRMKGKIPTWRKPDLLPGELSNVSEADVNSVDEP